MPEPRDNSGPEPPDSPAESLTETQVLPDHRARTADPAREIRLEVLGGPMDGTRVCLTADEVTIGRGPENDLRLSHDLLVSGSHARIARENRTTWLEDLDSRNGTWMGDAKLRARTQIGPGTIFRVGRTEVEFLAS